VLLNRIGARERCAGRQLHHDNNIAAIDLRNKTGRCRAKGIQADANDHDVDRHHRRRTAYRSRREPGNCKSGTVEGAIKIVKEQMNWPRPPVLTLTLLVWF